MPYSALTGVITYALVDVIPERVRHGVECPANPLAPVVVHTLGSTESSHLESESAGEDRSEEDIIPTDEEARRVLEELSRSSCRLKGDSGGDLLVEVLSDLCTKPLVIVNP